MKRVGFIGLGIMGGGMAGNLLKKGFELTVWNRDATKCQPLAEQGAKVAESPAQLAATCEVVVSMLRDDPVVLQLIKDEAMPAAARGTTFIEMSTVTPQCCQQLAAVAQRRGLFYLDSPVTGSSGAAAAGQLNLLVGGSKEVLEAQREILEAMSATITHIGPTASSAYLKLANNQMAAVMLASLGEAMLICEKGGIDRELALNTMIGTLSRVGELKKPKIAARNWDTQFSLDLMHKDMSQAMQAAEKSGLSVPVLAVARESYQRMRQRGKGELDFAVITDPDGE